MPSTVQHANPGINHVIPRGLDRRWTTPRWCGCERCRSIRLVKSPSFPRCPETGRAVCGSSRVNPSNKPATMRPSACPTMMAGSSDSGSTLLMMVRSAGGSWRRQPQSARQTGKIHQLKKRKRARENNSRARFKKAIGLLGRRRGNGRVGCRYQRHREQIGGCRCGGRCNRWRCARRRGNRSLHLLLLNLLCKV